MRPASLALVLAVALAALVVALPSASHADVSAVQGSAYGCYANTTFSFDPANPGPATETGPLPEVTLPPQGGSDTATAEVCVHRAFVGGPTVVSTGPLTVTTEGTTGPGGSVTSTATLGPVNTDGNENFTAANVSSECTADETGVSGTTTITGGVVHNAERPDGTIGDLVVPENPPVNYTVAVDIEFARYNYIFNEQIENPDGSITVNAVRMEPLTGPLQGTMILGQVVCGVTADTTTTTTLPDATTTTLPDATTTTLPDGTTTTTLPDATTTTTVPETTTTTTVPETTTTTTVPGPPPPTDAPCVDLRAGDDQVVGEVCVANTVTNLLVTYTTTGDWRLRATRLHVAHDADDVPRDGGGNADPQRFDHYQPLNRPPVTSFTHTIPLADLGADAGDQLIVAAQADVQRRARRGRMQTVSAWGDGTPFGSQDVQASSHRSRSHGATFFTYTVRDTTGMTCVDLRAGRGGRQTTGEVCASNAAGNLMVTYHTTGEWQLRATRLHVAHDVDGVPRNGHGHPRARDFAHRAPHRPPETSFTHTIPLAGLNATAGDELVVAAQADVQHPTRGRGMRTRSAWADGELFDTSHDHPAGFPLRYTYFTYRVR
ncbi:MAG TPA: hypothetical protein VM287_10760 [Egibacteraceae bacterium]|nr:hypothetical protein [Egibacteraceae bacterium]